MLNGLTVAQLLSHDLVVLGTATAIGALWTFPSLLVSGTLMCAAGIAAAWIPERAVAIFAIATPLTILHVIVATYRAAKAQAAKAQGKIPRSS